MLRLLASRGTATAGLLRRFSSSSPNVVSVTSRDQFEKLVQQEAQAVIVDFYADWCPPCKMLTPVLEKAVDAQAGKVVLAKVNSDEQEDISARHNIRSLPTVMAFVGGKVVDTFIGYRNSEEVSKFVTKAMAKAGSDTRSLSTTAAPATAVAASSPSVAPEPVSIQSRDQFEKLVAQKGPVIVDFYADWCGPCKMLTPVLEAAVKQNGKVVLAKVNSDEQDDIAARLQVRSLPTVMAFVNGKVVDTFVGYRNSQDVAAFLTHIVSQVPR